MAYVEPCGTIELYQLVTQPLSPSYNHTLWFPDANAQRTFFTNHLFASYTNQMYTRVNSNTIRIQGLADNLRNCNYMGFNNGRTSRWYYAFIINQDYINENVTEITFMIDEIQSWYLLCSWNECFIERQHSITDNVGDNLQPEPLECENYVVTKEIVSKNSQGVGYVLAIGSFTITKETLQRVFPVLPDPQNPTVSRQTKYGGYASTIKYLYFRSADELITFLNRMDVMEGGLRSLFESGDLWDVLGIYVVPTPSSDPSQTPSSIINEQFFNVEGIQITAFDFDGSGGILHVLSLGADPTIFELTNGVPQNDVLDSYGAVVQKGIKPSRLGFGIGANSYIPKNNKMLTYPFTYMSVDTPIESQEYRFEMFGEADIRFFYKSVCNPAPAIIIYPSSYYNDDNNYKYSLSIGEFPQIPAYQSGMMLGIGRAIGNGIKMLGKTALTGLSLLGGKAPTIASTALMKQIDVPKTFGATNGGSGFDVSSVYANMKENESPSMGERGGGIRGSMGVNDLAPIMATPTQMVPQPMKQINFSVKIQQWSILRETAKKYDDFLSKYGYAQNTVARPIIHARKNWTYIKTRDCCVSGPMPQVAIDTINKAMNSGITWWAATGFAGRYVGADDQGNVRAFYNPVLV